MPDLEPRVPSTGSENDYAWVNLTGEGTAGRGFVRDFWDYDPFAVLKIGGSIIKDTVQLNDIAHDIVYIHRRPLNEVVIHGAGPQITDNLKDAGIESKFDPETGDRITDLETLDHVVGALEEANDRLVHAIRRQGGDAIGISGEVFHATVKNYGRFGMVGTVDSVSAESIRDAYERHKIPVVTSIGTLARDHPESGQKAGSPVNINADVAATALAAALHPHKFLSITGIASVLDKAGNRIKELDPVSAQALIADGTISGGMLPKVRELLEILENGYADEVQISSPGALLLELFTDGSGTIMRGGPKPVGAGHDT